MELATKVTGPSIMLAEKESFSILTGTSMTVNGTATKQTDLVSIQISGEHATKVHGKTINSMEREWRTGQKEPSMKENTICQKKRALENTLMQMGHCIRASGLIIRLMDLEAIYGLMAANTLVSGLRMTCTAMASTYMLTM